MSLDDLNDAPQGGVPKWILGAFAPLVAARVGLLVMGRGHITIHGRGGPVEFRGIDATAWGLLILGAAGAAHCHYFWGNTDLLAAYADIGKIGSLALLIVAACFLFWRVFAA